MLYSHLEEFSGIGSTDLCYILYKMIGEEIEIFRIAVSYRKRRQGIGKEILEFLLNSEKEKRFFLKLILQIILRSLCMIPVGSKEFI